MYRPRAAGLAARLKKDLGVEVRLVEGGLGEFSVWVGDEKVAEKTRRMLIFPVFPSGGAVVEAVRARLGRER